MLKDGAGAMRFSFLAGRRGYRLGVAAAIVIALPTLGFGFFVDDYWRLMKIERGGPLSARLETFAFGMGDPEHIMAEMRTGPYLWFMDREFKARFCARLGRAGAVPFCARRIPRLSRGMVVEPQRGDGDGIRFPGRCAASCATRR